MKDFAGKTAVVTGGASGIGLALATAFLDEGANVVIADIEQEALDSVKEQLADAGDRLQVHRTDVTDVEAIEALAQFTLDTFGAVHVVCNNAGVETGGAFETIPEKAWRWVMDVNFFGILNGCRVFLPLLEQQEEGHIVNTASVAAFASGTSTMIPYCASKMAVLGLSESLDVELRSRDSNVSLSLLAPGPVKTRMTEAERNRPQDIPAASGDERQAVIERLRKTTEEVGLEPSEVAAQVLDSIRTKNFFVLTHPDIAIGGVQTRLNWMETGEAPAPRAAGS